MDLFFYAFIRNVFVVRPCLAGRKEVLETNGRRLFPDGDEIFQRWKLGSVEIRNLLGWFAFGQVW